MNLDIFLEALSKNAYNKSDALAAFARILWDNSFRTPDSTERMRDLLWAENTSDVRAAKAEASRLLAGATTVLGDETLALRTLIAAHRA